MWIRTLTILFLLAYSIPSTAQNLVLSDALEIPDRTFVKGILGEQADGSLIVLRAETSGKSGHDRYWLEHYNPDMSLKFSNELELPKVGEVPHRFEDLMFLRNKLVLFTSMYNKVQKKNYAFITTISAEGKIIDEPKPVDEISAFKLANIGEFDFVRSPDSSMVLVYHNEPYEKYTNEKFSYRVIDYNMNVLWEQQIELPYKNREFSIEHYELDQDANVHLLSRITQSEEKWVKGNPNFYYSILSYNHSTNAIKEYEINLGSRSISDISFTLGPEGHLQSAGFYSEEAKSENYTAGAFFLKIDPRTEKVVQRGFKKFNQGVVTEFIGERKALQGKELYNFNIKRFLPIEEGGALLIGEQTITSVSCYTDPRTGFQTCTDNYYFNDIIIVKFNDAGKVAWTRRVPKQQHSINDHGFYSSFTIAYQNGQLHLVFNDHAANTNWQEGKKHQVMTNLKKAIVAHVTVNADGSIKRQVITDWDNSEIILRPKISYFHALSNTLILFGQRRSKNYQLGKLRLS